MIETCVLKLTTANMTTSSSHFLSLRRPCFYIWSLLCY
ncbi:hypothetical protein Gotur_017441 [Gossypium turneri]